MKVLILTQPLIENYGGILQNYALQQILKRRGHEVYTLNTGVTLAPFKLHTWLFLSTVKQFLLRLLKKKRNSLPRCWLKKEEKKICYRKIFEFIQQKIRLTHHVSSARQLKHYRSFNAYVVGSDQVWRKAYSPWLPAYFLDFLPADCKAIKISYAASFGISQTDIPPQSFPQYAALLKRFTAISVREAAGKTLCKEHFGVDAEIVPDPTMLLSAEDYRSLFQGNTGCAKGKIVTYILDETPQKSKVINKFAEEHHLEVLHLRGSYTLNDLKSPNPEKDGIDFWLAAIDSAEYVITDSFHGTVFSLIFQKDFFVFGNAERGNARFEMLDELFNIKERFIDSSCNEIRIPEVSDFRRNAEIFEQCRTVGEKFLQKAGL